MELLELEKAVFEKNEKEFLNYLKANLSYDEPSRAIECISLIQKLEKDKKSILIARLERIDERRSLSFEVGLYSSFVLASIVAIQKIYESKLNVNAASIIILIIYLLIMSIALKIMMDSKEIKSDAKYYLSIIKQN